MMINNVENVEVEENNNVFPGFMQLATVLRGSGLSICFLLSVFSVIFEESVHAFHESKKSKDELSEIGMQQGHR